MGLFWLTGSQQFEMIKNVSESLAGRIGILEMYNLSRNEKEGILFDDELDFSLECLQSRQSIASKTDAHNVFSHIWMGGIPKLITAKAEERHEYYNSYVSTYLMRDVVNLGDVTDMSRFAKFLTVCAALIQSK